jgi:hypothetical protein
MSQELNKEEQLKLENDFLKMKLMLENGAEFGVVEEARPIPLELENEFMRNIIEFERNWENPKRVKLFDKIERPVHFKPVMEIPDDEMETAWNNLSAYLQQYGISLDACSPNINKRELYRFALEELFEHEMDDINIPGMMHGFIYDEFHPDPEYENTEIATRDCISRIFEKEPLEWMHYFRESGVQLNDHVSLGYHQLKEKINRFKESFEELTLVSLEDICCGVEGMHCKVNGRYRVEARIDKDLLQLSGQWEVELEKEGEDEHSPWFIGRVYIEGIEF